MYDETAGRKGRERTTTRREARGRKAQARRKGWVAAWRYGDGRGRSGGKGVSRVPKERRALGDCVRQLFTTISLNRPRLLPVSAAFVSRNLRDRRVSTYRDLGCSLSGLFSVACDETTPYPRPYVPQLPRARYYGKGAYLRRCAHITPADKLASLSSCLYPSLSLLPSLVPASIPPPPPISPGFTLLHFSCNLREVLQGSSSSLIPLSRTSSTILGVNTRASERTDV